MLRKNKITTYLLYAIGEIVLVVVGILIAVSIDDWNQQLAGSKKEQIILRGLKKELQETASTLDFYFERRSENEMRVRSYLDTIMSGRISTTIKAKYPIPGIFGRTFSKQSSYLNSVIFSGEIDLIKNDQLKSELAAWQNTLAVLKDGSIGASDILGNRELLDYISERMPGALVSDESFEKWIILDLHPEDELATYRMQFVDDFTFHNKLKEVINRHHIRRAGLRSAITKCDELLELIDRELENKR